MSFTLAIVGRPNVGKSTLFNRLVGQRLALVDDQPGVTRDRRYGEGKLFDLTFDVVDTAGLEEVFDKSLKARMRKQTERAVEEADLVLLLIDARAGLSPLDEHFAQWLRRQPTPVVVVANKHEGKTGDPGLMEAYGLGLGEPVPLSAEHGLGFSDLYDFVRAGMVEAGYDPEFGINPTNRSKRSGDESEAGERDQGPLRLAIVGRPNVGKSTLINGLLGEDRLLTGPEAGITRDSISIDWTFKGREIKLFDTAGLRKKAKVDGKVEKLSAADGLRAVRFAHVVVVLLDAEAAMERQDLSIAGHVIEEGRAVVIGLNKWDSCRDRQATLQKLHDRLTRSLPQVKEIPVVTLSALQGRNLDRLMDGVFEAYDVWNRRVPTGQLNRWLEGVVSAHPPPAPGGRRIRLKYITQIKSRPPTFTLFGSQTHNLPRSYLRYLENGLRENFDLAGTPIRLYARKGNNPYA